MRIASANLQMAATHAASQRHEISESLRAWVGSKGPDFAERKIDRPVAPPVQISDAARNAQGKTAPAAGQSGKNPGDGHQIDFQLGRVMERSFQAESQASLRLGDAARKKDPLVLNFSGTAAQLTDTRFTFDLDGDGQAESINFAAPGSGFLVLDRNRDGKVNNGTEMFGPASGDGFAELASLDGDHNGWIDENDAAYRDLQIWINDAEGQDRLESLAEAGVGAIALGRVNSSFDLKDEANRMQGQVRSSGVFLHESGKAGTIQQIDLTI